MKFLKLPQRTKSILKRVRYQKLPEGSKIIEDNQEYLSKWLNGDDKFDVCDKCLKIRLIATQDCGCSIGDK